MTLKELREEAWTIARDTASIDSDKLWPKAEMNLYINRVYNHIARETKCIRDSITPDICRIAVAPPTDLADLTTKAASDSFYAQDLAWYNNVNSWLYGQLVAPYSFALSPKILEIMEVKWTVSQWRLTKVSAQKWQQNSWWEQVIGMPTEYATDLDTNRIALNYRLTSSDTLRLNVKRMPLAKLSSDTDTPEFKEQYQELMINGILMWMYGKQDAEAFDMEKRDRYEARFMKDIDEIKQEEEFLDRRLKPNNSLDAFR